MGKSVLEREFSMDNVAPFGDTNNIEQIGQTIAFTNIIPKAYNQEQAVF